MSRPAHPFRLSTLLALLGGGVGCGIVYTSDQPLWYVTCEGIDQDCSCYSEGFADFTQFPSVKECSAQKAGGVCCGDGSYDCSCKAVRCVNTGVSCQCAFWPKATGDLRDCGTPPAGQSCCMDAKSAICTCSSQACGAGTTQLPSCSPQYFTCELLAGSDSAPSGDSSLPFSTCSGSGENGAIDNESPCPEAYDCGF